MSRYKRVLNFHIENSEHLRRLMNGLSHLKVDLDVDSSPSSVKICVHGPRGKVRDTCREIKKLVDETQPK